LASFKEWEVVDTDFALSRFQRDRHKFVARSGRGLTVRHHLGSIDSLQGYWRPLIVDASIGGTKLPATTTEGPRPDWGSELVALGKVPVKTVRLGVQITVPSAMLSPAQPTPITSTLTVSYPSRTSDTAFTDASTSWTDTFSVVALGEDDYATIKPWFDYLVSVRGVDRRQSVTATLVVITILMVACAIPVMRAR
jgi:hypothetical protein